ncbi:MAG: endonuclease/exonuclease/phosphatase family protein [Trueperella sp.]|nr:endonuclease/exonuclease/phosphatase family protein [Trueperella sp.]
MIRLRIGTFNIQHSKPRSAGITARSAVATLGAELAALDLDYLAMQEVDAGRERSGNLDQPRLIADALQMSGRFCPTLPGYGLASFTRHPSESWCGSPLPNQKQWRNVDMWLQAPEPRGWIGTRLFLADAAELLLANTHLAVEPERAQLQLASLTAELAQMAGPNRPVILLGDLNLLPAAVAEVAPQWVALATGDTTPMPHPRRQIDHILGWNLPADSTGNFGANVQELSVSDHAGLIAEIRL